MWMMRGCVSSTCVTEKLAETFSGCASRSCKIAMASVAVTDYGSAAEAFVVRVDKRFPPTRPYFREIGRGPRRTTLSGMHLRGGGRVDRLVRADDDGSANHEGHAAGDGRAAAGNGSLRAEQRWLTPGPKRSSSMWAGARRSGCGSWEFLSGR